MRHSPPFAAALLACVVTACVATPATAQQSACPDDPSLRPGASSRIAAVDPARLINANGSPRLTPDSDYRHFLDVIAPRLEEWSRDPRLQVSPAYIAALIAKESGFEPKAVSGVPAYGYAQITHVADQDMREIASSAPHWNWAASEMRDWPRDSVVHSSSATRAETLERLASGELGADTDYLFDPATASRAAMIWVGMLMEIWTSDRYPGRYGTFAADRLAEGGDLREGQLFDLVTASYNQGYVYVRDLVERWGADWREHLNEEAADHLERIRFYTCLFGGG